MAPRSTEALRIGSLAAHVIELKPQGANVVEQQLRERRRRFRAASGRRAVHARPGVQRAGPAAAGALLELVAPHGDLRHRGLEIKWRLRIERCGRREAIAGHLASLSGVGQICPDRFEPTHGVDERTAVAVSRGVVPVQNLGDRFKGASRLRFGAREPHFKALDGRIKSFRRRRRARRVGPFAFVSSGDPFQASGGGIEPIDFSAVVFWPRGLIQTGVVGDHFVEPIVEAHAGAPGGLHGGLAGPPVQARDIPRHRSIHVLDRRSEAANRRMNGGDAAD